MPVCVRAQRRSKLLNRPLSPWVLRIGPHAAIWPPAREDQLPRLLGPLPDDLSRILVVAEPEKARLPQPTVARPFSESDLSD